MLIVLKSAAVLLLERSLYMGGRLARIVAMRLCRCCVYVTCRALVIQNRVELVLLDVFLSSEIVASRLFVARDVCRSGFSSVLNTFVLALLDGDFCLELVYQVCV